MRKIVRTHDATISELRCRMIKLDTVLRDRTDVAVDVRLREPNYVIVVGRYKNVDYIQTYSVASDELCDLVGMLKKMERHARVRVVDAPPQMRAVFNRGTPYG